MAMLEVVLLGHLWKVATPVIDVCGPDCKECWTLVEELDRRRGVDVVGDHG